MPQDAELKPGSDVSSSLSACALHDYYSGGFTRIRKNFEAQGDGRAAARERSALVDAVMARLYHDLFSPQLGEPENFCLVALGGYGRQELFPHSDIDLLFLATDGQTLTTNRQALATMTRGLWDLGLRVGNSARTIAECGQLHRDNLEFNISLLDCRYLAGGRGLFARLRDRTIPHLVARDREDLVRDLVGMTRLRHAKDGNTIFHLEPNLKETPGGLRDYQVARWLTLIAQLEKKSRWVVPEEAWSEPLKSESRQALAFLSAARCFLHYFQGRDDNQLTYELQDRAASAGIGQSPGVPCPADEWMRRYFRHARCLYRLASQRLDETRPARSSLYDLVVDRKSRHSNLDFSVVRGRIFPRQPEAVLSDPGLLFRLFELMSQHGLEISHEAERWVEESLQKITGYVFPPEQVWPGFRRILLSPHAAETLGTMHRLGFLVALFPEFRVIDCLVIRDFYHRYTVDEHSFMALRGLEALRSTQNVPPADQFPDTLEGWNRKYAEIFAELERPELLSLSLVFHDVGKGMGEANHVEGSLKALDSVLARLRLGPEESETVRFLVAQHLEMSATVQRRDIFDPETVRSFAERVGTHERLKMLCLFTYADINAVNPEALTPWKAEMLWQLYVAASNYLTRSLDDDRVHMTGGEFAPSRRALASISTAVSERELMNFLDGFPKRYLVTHSPEEIAGHFELAKRLVQDPVQVGLRFQKPLFEMTVLTQDRPYLFASITGTLAAWGMNIVKADAFANQAGTVLDTFRFVDLFRTLELNPTEIERFKRSLVDVLQGKADVRELIKGRANPQRMPRPKVRITVDIRFDNTSSSHSTLLELVTQDRPGLLYEVGSVLADLGCNIEVALIDTEGPKVIDAFYLTRQGAKLTKETQEEIRRDLLERL